MSSVYQHSDLQRIGKALERIADALEARAKRDPVADIKPPFRVSETPVMRWHTIPEGYKRLPKGESCPQAWRESDGSQFCPHGSAFGLGSSVWEHDMLQAKYRERITGHTVSDTARQRGFDVLG